MKTKFMLLAVGMILMAVMVGQANASTITLQYQAILDGVTLSRSLDGGTTWKTNAQAGQFKFLVVADPDNVSSLSAGDTLYTFCIEPNEFVNTSALVYDVNALENAPIAGVPIMGSAAADLLRELYFTYYPTNQDIGALQSRALQIATWEIVTDPTSLNVTSGNTQFLAGAGGTAAQDALDEAQTMLTAIATPGGSMRNILAATYEGAQDPWFPQVPEPTTLVLLGLGLAAIGIVNRRRR